MKRVLLLSLSALLLPLGVYAQGQIPKVEFSVGGGFGIGGYVAPMPDNAWMQYIGQDAEIEGNMLFYRPKSLLRPAGHAGLYVDFNFTDHWGLITGAEAGFYYPRIKSDNLLNMESYSFPTGSESADEYLVANNLPDFLEKHRMLAVQIPVMGKYMTPINPVKGHQYYVAAGVKVGIHVLGQYSQSWSEGGMFGDVAGKTMPDNDIYYIRTNNGPAPGHPDMAATRVNPHFKFTDDSSYQGDWNKLKMSPVDVMASFDTGIRWNLGNGLGLYTGLYCDFGLLRSVAFQKGKKVMYLPEGSMDIVNDFYDAYATTENAEYTSILAAEGPDNAYHGPDAVTPTGVGGRSVWVYNENPFAKSVHAMQAGVKIRFSFGKVGPKKVKEPKPKKPQKPQVTEVPPEIKQTMIELSDALFAFDKFNLSEEARQMLDKVVEWLKDNPELNVEIGGHTDSKGSDEYNQKLSENRAKSVYDYFVEHGISASRLSYKGYGESRPIATNDTDEGRQRNRRVELQLK